jgi:hypothetical protein
MDAVEPVELIELLARAELGNDLVEQVEADLVAGERPLEGQE